MSSPVKFPFTSFITIDRRKEDAVYLQIVYQFINAIRRKLLEDGDRLPGSRKIAEELGVHRKTVVAALAELKDQGWLESRPSIGTFVINPEIAPTERAKKFKEPPKEACYDFRREFILDSPFQQDSGNFYFTDGTSDYRVIKSVELVRFYASVLRRKKHAAGSVSQDGSQFFQKQLSYYLNQTRKFHLSRDYLLTVKSFEQAMSILTRLLIQPGVIVLVEEWSYFLANMIFSQAGAKLKTVPVDAEGMDTDYIEKNFAAGEIRCVYLNTQSQYPTTAKLSEKRKVKLLELAEKYNFVIIENDTDFEFSSKSSRESLFRKDGGNRVLYLGAFGRFLNPGFQMNFLIAPKDVLEEAKKHLTIFGRPDPMMEKALGEMIHQGDIHRYRRKAQKTIEERKMKFAQLLNNHFGKQIDFVVPHSGLAFWVRFRFSFSLTRLQEKATKKGLLLPGICLYQNRNLTALRLGFAHLNTKEMEKAVGLLAEVYGEVAIGN